MATNTQLSAAAIQQLLVIRQELPQWGSRRPTSYPEWVTLEVAHGGFATGRAQASFELDKARKIQGDDEVADARTNQSFLTEEGLQELAAMLDSGRYQIEFPENSAFLVLVHLLRQDRVQDARDLMQELAPYVDDIRFYPTATDDAPAFSPYKVGVTDVGTLKRMLSYINDTAGKRGNTQIHHRDGCDLYEPIQAEAVKLLLASTGLGGTPVTADNDKLLLTQVSDELKADIKKLVTRYWVINPNASGIVKEVVDTRTPRTPHPVSNHTRKNATTRVFIEALCTAVSKKSLTAAELQQLGDRLRKVIEKRGVLGTAAHDEVYRARVELSSNLSGNNHAVAQAAIAVLKKEKRGDQTFLNENEVEPLTDKIQTEVSASSSNVPVSSANLVFAPRVYHGGSSSGLPTVVASGISRTTARTIEEHIQAGVINSAEMIADVVPMLFNAAASNKIQDPILRTLYCSLAVAFSRRRSLLLVDLSSQVRLDELPWAKPMLAGLSGAHQNNADVVATIDTIRIATRAWLDHFPQTMTPNRLVSSIKSVMRGLKGSSTEVEMPRLLEELASDIFMGSFSSNFSLSTLQAARALQGTIYERYYNITPVYADLIARMGPLAERTDGGRDGVTAMSGILLEAATNCMPLWNVRQGERRNYTVENGRTIEAVMVLSTHNLCQLYAWLGLGNASPAEGGVDNLAAARKTWKHIVGLFESPPDDTYYGYRMVAYAWRQLLFFLSMEEKRVTGSGDAASIGAFRATMASLCAEFQQVVTSSKLETPMKDRLNGKFIDVLRKVAVDGKANRMNDIQKPDAEKGVAHGDYVLGYFSWAMFNVGS